MFFLLIKLTTCKYVFATFQIVVISTCMFKYSVVVVITGISTINDYDANDKKNLGRSDACRAGHEI